MNEVGKIRLTTLRIFYLLTGVSLGLLASFNFFNGDSMSDGLQDVRRAVFFALSILSIAGILQPLKMLPLLLFSLAWKSIWIMAFVLPMYLGGSLDAHTKNIFLPVFSGFIVTLIAVPWKYTVSHYFTFKTTL